MKLLPAMKEWWKNHTISRLQFTTETTINLADDKELMLLMADTGFDSVFYWE